MIVSFNIEYRTNWGEEVRISGSLPELGNENSERSIPLHTVDGIHWTVETEIHQPDGFVDYSYLIWQDGKVVRREWDSFPRRLYLSGDSKKKYRIDDSWKNLPEQQYFYSSAFTESLLAHRDRTEAPKSYKKGLMIKAYAPRINENYCLAICGNQKALGDWNPDKALLMSDINFPEWQIAMDASKINFPLEYKFVLYNRNALKHGKTIRTAIWPTRN